MRVLIIILLGVLTVFQYDLWFGKSGYADYQKAKNNIAKRQLENKELSQRNQLVSAEIKDLRDGVDAVEEKARMDYGMIKPGEHFYRIVKSEPKTDD